MKHMTINNVEVHITNFSHPTITTGMHTNGPAHIWIKVNDEWIATGSTSMYRVKKELEDNGSKRIVNQTWNGGYPLD